MAFKHGTPNSIVTDGLVFCVDPANVLSWSGPNSSTVNDLIGTNTGTIYNDTSGSYGDNNSFTFDGTDDYINFGSSVANFDEDSSFTIDIWFKQNDLSGRKDIISRMSSDRGWALRFNREVLNNDKYYLLLQSTGGSTQIFGAADFSIEANRVYNMVFTYNGSGNNSGIAGYINGNDYGMTNVGGTLSQTISNSTSMNIGKSNNSNPLPFNGLVYSSKIYNKVLSLAEVTQNYNALKNRFRT
jgi:hypothetical protein